MWLVSHIGWFSLYITNITSGPILRYLIPHINLIISVDTGVDIAYIVDIADIDVDIDDIDIKNPLANTDVDTDILNCDF